MNQNSLKNLIKSLLKQASLTLHIYLLINIYSEDNFPKYSIYSLFSVEKMINALKRKANSLYKLSCKQELCKQKRFNYFEIQNLSWVFVFLVLNLKLFAAYLL